jgi:cytochrome c oxidase subunit 2
MFQQLIASLGFSSLAILVLVGISCKPQPAPQPAPQETSAPVMEEKSDVMMEEKMEGEAMMEETNPAMDEKQTDASSPAPESKAPVPEPAPTPAPAPTPTPAPAPETEPEPAPQQPVAQVRTFNITAKQWDFSPSTITVSQGDTVRLNVTSTDVAHGIAISAFGVNERLEPGKTTAIEFIADKKGTFTFFCSVFCGSGHGSMKGTLIVE